MPKLSSVIEQVSGDFKMVKGQDVDINSAEDFNDNIVDADTILVDDGDLGSKSSTKKSTMSRLWTYILGKITSVFLVDEDNMTSNSDVKFPTQQSVKAYVDSKPDLTVNGAGTIDANNVPTLNQDTTGNAATADALTSGSKVITGGLSVTTEFSSPRRKFVRTASATHFDVQGDVLYFGSGSTTQGDLCYLKEDGSWGQADADGAAVGDDADRDAMGMLAIALGTDPDINGMLIKGIITMASDMGDVGNPIYIKTTAGGMSHVAPGASGDFVRVVGYCLDDNNGIMYFNPDNTWVEIA